MIGRYEHAVIDCPDPRALADPAGHPFCLCWDA
jgi:hypothetical protein